ncbi:MAG TPA: 1-(5-phosphoribosyl)-5-[(5-phosphoribosylamino)methylideneamino]imidazole-4-carboxamide isomerase [Solirubrobacteraceae bacterium]|jgi:phosphoribosylformimino-5-aminoimidazole carboxamide ribotide isomerase
MILYPAVDILGGKAVRLTKGDFDDRKVYEQDPFDAAASWVSQGASYLHVVDLDGAKAGEPRNLEHLKRIASELQVPVQYGGGLRSAAAIEQALQAGAARAILGTAAFKDPELLSLALQRWPGQVLVSVDSRGGKVATAGWTQTSEMATVQAIETLVEHGACDLVHTDVDRDGMLGGPDLDGVLAVARAARGGSLIYSGGIGAIEDLQALAELQEPALSGVIVGKALYERRFTVAEALATLGG